ncbi:helix-turn-helix domain-containing protein [Streptomyces sp. NPDC017405]|uniref:helix-turn-helix domain-containing protein n=1 Tax=unclassified Streptomyces TaxID=2593676 RepID=UPI0037B2DC3E
MTASRPEPASAFPEKPTRYQVVRRLTRAAAHSDAHLIAEAAALSRGWAALVDPMGRLICSTPDTAGPGALRAATYPQLYPHLTIHKMIGGVLVIRPDASSPASRTALIARTTVDLLRMRARVRQADEIQQAEQRLHTAVLRLLRGNQPHLVTEVLGEPSVTHATLFRLTGQSLDAAQQALWRAARPSLSPSTHRRMLVCLEGQELVVVALHGADDDHRWPLALVKRVASRHQLAAGVGGPVPLDMVTTAWTETGSALHRSPYGCVTAASGMGAHGLLRVVPVHQLTAWSAAVLRPLDREQQRTLEASLRSGSVRAAASVLDVSEGTVRTRLRGIGTLLDTDLHHPTVQAQLLLAVRAPAVPARNLSPMRLAPDPPVPTELLSPDQARRWASASLKALDKPQRIAMRCWLRHGGRTAPAAAELHLSRSTLTHWLTRSGKALCLNLSSPTVRGELHLAAETIATPDETPGRLPRRGGRMYRGLRP